MPLPVSPLDYVDLANTRETFEQATAEDRLDTSRPYVTRSYRRRFLVTTRYPGVGPGVVREVAKLIFGVEIGCTYARGRWGVDPFAETDINSFCVGIRAYCSGVDGCDWVVDVAYEPIDPQVFDEFIDNPLLAPPEIDYQTIKYERALDVDYDSATIASTGKGKPVLNSAQDPFDPPVMRDHSRFVMTVQRNEAIDVRQAVSGVVWDDSIPEKYNDTINKYTFFGRDPHRVKVDSITGRIAWHPGLYDPSASPAKSGYFAQVTYVYHIDRNGWDAVVVDRGYRKLNTTTHKQEQILVNGIPATSEVLLDGTGQPANPDATTNKIAPHYFTYQRYPEVDLGTKLRMGV